MSLIGGLSNITIDGAGYTVASSVSTAGQNVLIKNCRLIGGGLGITGSNTTITNNWVFGTSVIFASNVTFSNNLLDGGNAATTDDLASTAGGPPVGPSLSNIKFLNNIVQHTFDVGFEGAGGWDQCTLSGNYFTDVQWAMGGVYDSSHNNGFTTTNCTFQNNTVHPSGSYSNTIFIFNYVVANDDGTANSLWGGSGTSLVNNNTFSGNIRQ